MPLTDLDRGGDVSMTQQLVDRFAQAIERGDLPPGEKLPPTRVLAVEAGINHLTAARVYRRLAEAGYVTAAVGRGTFVRRLAPGAAEQEGDTWQSYVLPDRPASYQEEILADAFRLGQEERMISLATGFPSPQLCPTDELAAFAAQLFAEERSAAIAYTNPEGLPALRERIAARGRVRGFADGPDEIVVTSGGQQAIDVAVRAIVEPGDVVVVESPTFVGILAALRSTGARVVGVPVDDDGFDVGALEQVLTRHEIKLCALQPACQNPTGTDLSPDRRARLAALARERNFFVLEDGVYADLRYEGERLTALRAEAPGHVLHVNSLSKVVGGGLRLGWIAARGPVLERVTTVKQTSDFHTSTLVQHLAARYLATDGYERNLERSVPYYRQRRDALVAALGRHLAGEVSAAVPRGGHHLWVTLERPVEERTLYSQAVRHGVAFTPGGAVSVERPRPTSFRLSFSLLDPELLEEGVKRLARALRAVHRGDRRAATAPFS